MKSLLIFLPHKLYKEKHGYMFGKIVYDDNTGVKKFYVIGVCNVDNLETMKCTSIIGYYSGSEHKRGYVDKKYLDWINICLNSTFYSKCDIYDYSLKGIIVNNKKISTLHCHTAIIVYDQSAFRETELFAQKAVSGDHFYELMKITQNKQVEREIQKKGKCTYVKETLLVYHMFLYFYPVLFLAKITNKLLPVLKYSFLGLHLNGWLENVKWMLITVIKNKKFNLKTDNAEKAVTFLKDLINWLMGVPAGLKLNHALNNMLGKFFLYHIHMWWTFLIFMKPVMDFTFEVLVLFGKLGITFQIAIAADLLALVSFHAYCIYVYAARLFNIQLKGITALFRLFLGKKKNPLRERIDSCQYQPDQLFVGTLLFTILLFLMPTTWVYYVVFTMLRLALISFGGLLTRMKFYLQVMPVYTFFKWLFHSYSTCSIVNIKVYSNRTENPIILIMTMVVASWHYTWDKCIPDTINRHPPIEWNKIINNIMWEITDKIDNNVDTFACDTNQVENVNKQDMKRKRQNEKRRNNIDDNINEKIIEDDKEENVYTEINEDLHVEDTNNDEESSPNKKANICTTNGLNDTEEIYKNNLKTSKQLSKRQLKKQKAEQRKNEKRMANRIEAMTKGLNYVSKWKYARSEWKFEKIRQIWLIDNLLDKAHIPDDIFPIVLEYFEGCKGMARELLLKKGLDVVRKVDNEENKDEVESIAYQRARKLLQALPTET
ncbi:uncharacterized protein LOC100642225 isoform X2 [Bombus terrestris]|uniref:Uncharacterized protein LOC100642225 isoform X2 n=1 Tax=Bombus terrestris TaxID=30195 RepID=A0A9B2JSU8_BOMTE|nr:uncharacterized protein LOC100642225 isoform X2 [Bombus terrestris]